MLDLEYKSFIVYIATLSFCTSLSFNSLDADIYPSHKPEIAGLIADEALTKSPNKDVDFVDIFSPNLTTILSEHTKINNHAIKLVDD